MKVIIIVRVCWGGTRLIPLPHCHSGHSSCERGDTIVSGFTASCIAAEVPWFTFSAKLRKMLLISDFTVVKMLNQMMRVASALARLRIDVITEDLKIIVPCILGSDLCKRKQKSMFCCSYLKSIDIFRRAYHGIGSLTWADTVFVYIQRRGTGFHFVWMTIRQH